MQCKAASADAAVASTKYLNHPFLGPLSPRGPPAAGAPPISWPGYEVSSTLWCDDEEDDDDEEEESGWLR